jgi:hypothetical protein
MYKRCGFNICFLNRIIHRKITLIESNATCRYLKQLTCKGTLRQVFEGPLPSYDPILPPPPYTLYTQNAYTVYLFTQEKGGGGANQNEGEGQSQSRSKIPT